MSRLSNSKNTPWKNGNNGLLLRLIEGKVSWGNVPCVVMVLSAEMPVNIYTLALGNNPAQLHRKKEGEKNAVKLHKHCQELSCDKCMLAALPNHPRGSPRSRMSLFFAPFERGKWGSLNWCGFIVSPAVWSNKHIAHSPSPPNMWHSTHICIYPLWNFVWHGGTWWPPVYRSCFQVWLLSKTQATCVYHHSGPFIHKLPADSITGEQLDNPEVKRRDF